MSCFVAPQALACVAASVSTSAAGIRAHMPTAVPFRLLLPPLLGHWQAAAQRGPDAARRLLVMLTAMLGSADSKVVAAAADPVFDFLLRALDTRQQPPDGFGPEGKLSLLSRTACVGWVPGPPPLQLRVLLGCDNDFSAVIVAETFLQDLASIMATFMWAPEAVHDPQATEHGLAT